MAARTNEENGERLSFETLVIASIASAIAAIVTSQFWQGGTPIAAAVTPVLVSLVSEGLRRPMRSELVRKPARRAVELGSTPVRRYRSSEQRVLTPPARDPDRSERATEPLMPTTNGERPTEPEEPEPSYTVYRGNGSERPGWRERLSRNRVKVALVTGLLAFLIAGLALTLPELIFGGSVTGTDRNTTFFGGGGKDGGDGDRDRRDQDESRESEGGESRDTPSPDQPSGSAPTPDEGGGSSGDSPPSEQPPPQDGAPAPGPSVPQPAPEAPAPPTP